MKIFLIGQSKSGRTTMAMNIVEAFSWKHIDVSSWLTSIFRPMNQGEHPLEYEEASDNFYTQKMIDSPNFISDYIMSSMNSQSDNYIIDGLCYPNSFITWFDYNKDIVIFLNRTDNEKPVKEQDSMGIQVIRDYCYWLASCNLLERHRWIEYNFKMAEEQSDHMKAMGVKNSVFLIRSFKKVIAHFLGKLSEYV